MDNVNLKAQLGNQNLFKQTTKNDLSKNMVSSFDQKEASMHLFKETEKNLEDKKFKKKKVVEEKKTKSSELKTDEEKKITIQKLMNII